jgi:hypothetical protein
MKTKQQLIRNSTGRALGKIWPLAAGGWNAAQYGWNLNVSVARWFSTAEEAARFVVTGKVQA